MRDREIETNSQRERDKENGIKKIETCKGCDDVKLSSQHWSLRTCLQQNTHVLRKTF